MTAAKQLPLERYQNLLLSLEVSLGSGESRPFLFDTGAGLICLTPDSARALKLEPVGRLTGFRKSGERIDGPRCEDVGLTLLGPEPVAVRGEGLILDLMELLPPDWPALGGAVGLNAFEGLSIRLNKGRELWVAQSPEDLMEGEGWREGRCRAARQAGGAALSVFLSIDGPQGSLWFELDSGSTGPLLLAPHASEILGLGPEVGAPPSPQVLTLTGAGELKTQVVVTPMIYDGLIGLRDIERWDLVLDLANFRIWIHR